MSEELHIFDFPYKCPYCNKKFKTYPELSRHMNTQHPWKEKSYCKILVKEKYQTMPEFKHKKDGGRVLYLFSLRERMDGQPLNVYGCQSCHLMWWDHDNRPLTQEMIDKS